MAKKEQDSGLDQYKGLAKLLIKIVSSILFLIFLYLAYTPTDIKHDDIQLAAGDWVFLLALALLFIAAIIYYYSPKQLLFSLIGTSKILDNHPRGAYISFFVCIGAAIVIIEVLIGFSSSLAKVLVRLSSPDEPLNIRNILLGFAGITGLCLAAWRSRVLDRQAKTMEQRRDQDRKEFKIMEQRRVDERRAEERSEERRYDERFADAVKSLSKELNETSYPSHLGAIVALRDLAIDNNNYTQRCLDILCSCNQWMEGYLEKFAASAYAKCYADKLLAKDTRIAKSTSAITLHHERRSQASLQYISSVIRYLGENNEQENILSRLNFSNKMICGINLFNAKIIGINFSNAYLNGADIGAANMQSANLSYAKMQGVNLLGADMQQANLFKTQLQGANLMSVKLQETMLAGTLLQAANLSHADMRFAVLAESHLEGADLSYAKMQGAEFMQTFLQGSHIVSTQLQAAKFFETKMQGAVIDNSHINGTVFLQCNLYGAEIGDNHYSNIIFDEISKHEHIQTEKARDFWINAISDLFIDKKIAKVYAKKMRVAWDKTDRGEMPSRLNDFKQASILEKDKRNNWAIKQKKLKELKVIYRALLSDLSASLDIKESSIVNLLNGQMTFYPHLKNPYNKIGDKLDIVWSELKEEFADKE